MDLHTKPIWTIQTTFEELITGKFSPHLSFSNPMWSTLRRAIPLDTQVCIKAAFEGLSSRQMTKYQLCIGLNEKELELMGDLEKKEEEESPFFIKLNVATLQLVVNNWFQMNNLGWEVQHTFDPSLGGEGTFFFKPVAAPTIVESNQALEFYFPWEVRVDWPMESGVGYGGSHAICAVQQSPEDLTLHLTIAKDIDTVTTEGWGTWKELILPQAIKRVELCLKEIVGSTVDLLGFIPDQFVEQFKGENKNVVERLSVAKGIVELEFTPLNFALCAW
jgi:hypothetical protein